MLRQHNDAWCAVAPQAANVSSCSRCAGSKAVERNGFIRPPTKDATLPTEPHAVDDPEYWRLRAKNTRALATETKHQQKRYWRTWRLPTSGSPHSPSRAEGKSRKKSERRAACSSPRSVSARNVGDHEPTSRADHRLPHELDRKEVSISLCGKWTLGQYRAE